MTAIVVIDIGKSNAKLSVVDTSDGAVIASESRETGSLDAPPYPHLDTGGLWAWYVAQLKRARKLTPISYICVTTHGASAALVDDQDLVLPVLDYEYTGPDEFADDYDALCDPFDITFSPKLPQGLNLGRQLYWQRKKYPEQFARAKYLLTYPQYWTWRLTGIPAAEVTSIGAHSDLWRPKDKTFSEFMIKQGWDRLVPPLMRADAALGNITAEIASATGIGADCKVQVGIHDSNASLVPYLQSRAAPFTVVSTGTWVICFAVGAPLEQLAADRDCVANINMYGDPVACARYMGGREFAAVAGEVISPSSPVDLHRVIDENLYVMPGFAKAGGPFPSLNSSGYIDASRPLSAVDSTTLASVYCALVTDECLSLCGSLGDIIVEGVYAKNQMLMQILAVLREEQCVFGSTDSTGTTMGTAMLATKNIAAPTLSPPPTLDGSLREKLLRYRHQWRQRVTAHQQATRIGRTK